MKTIFSIKQGDITKEKIDAIVNAANSSLLGGGGVDGAIHFAAGPDLLEECRLLGGCATGEAKVTNGYNLPAKFVIHTVGPVFGQEHGREDELLASCYWNSLMIAKEKGIKTIAFPCISTGVFRFPKDQAAKIAIDTIKKFVAENPDVLDEVLLVTHEDLDFHLYKELVLKDQS